MARESLFAHAHAVVMAGGSGTRFWPLSRRKHPKQLLELFGRGTLLEQTVARLASLIPPERVWIYTNELIWREVCRRLPQIPRAQIVAEPASRNTAPTLGVAAHEIWRRDPEGLMLVLPADHVIAKPAEFLRVLRSGGQMAAQPHGNAQKLLHEAAAMATIYRFELVEPSLEEIFIQTVGGKTDA